MNKKFNAYLLGGGIGSLAVAAFMIRDGGLSGKNIFILELSTGQKVAKVGRKGFYKR